MKIISLVENTRNSEKLNAEHGLSVYIETEHNKILFDTGASDAFLHNASSMGLDIASVDALVVSHGHYDHGGGMRTFIDVNKKAPIYIQEAAFGDFYSKRSNGEFAYIGLDPTLQNNERIVWVKDYEQIFPGVEIFSDFQNKVFFPKGNATLFMDSKGTVLDTFLHEHVLVIEENDTFFLCTGCAHNGIVTILESFNERYARYPDYVLGGFHLHSGSAGITEDDVTIKNIAAYLLKTKAHYYTGHCTGEKPFALLKSLMGEYIEYASTGLVIEI